MVVEADFEEAHVEEDEAVSEAEAAIAEEVEEIMAVETVLEREEEAAEVEVVEASHLEVEEVDSLREVAVVDFEAAAAADLAAIEVAAVVLEVVTEEVSAAGAHLEEGEAPAVVDEVEELAEEASKEARKFWSSHILDLEEFSLLEVKKIRLLRRILFQVTLCMERREFLSKHRMEKLNTEFGIPSDPSLVLPYWEESETSTSRQVAKCFT